MSRYQSRGTGPKRPNAVSKEFTEEIMGVSGDADKTPEQIIHDRMTPTKDELDKAAHNDAVTDIENPLERWTDGSEAPPQGEVSYSVQTLSIDLFGGNNMADEVVVIPDAAAATVATPSPGISAPTVSTPNPIWEEIKKDAGIVLNLFAQFAPMVMAVVAPKSKATPFVTAIAPQIAPAMAAAQTMFNSTGDGATRENAAIDMLKIAVSTGKVLSTGGQAHTLQDLEDNIDTIKQIFTGTVSTVKAVTAAATPLDKVSALIEGTGTIAGDAAAVASTLDKKDATVINKVAAQVQAIAYEFSAMNNMTIIAN